MEECATRNGFQIQQLDGLCLACGKNFNPGHNCLAFSHGNRCMAWQLILCDFIVAKSDLYKEVMKLIKAWDKLDSVQFR